MRNFTKIVLSLAMAFGLLGGVSSVSATKTYWAPSTAIATWNSETKTMTWTTEDAWHIMNSGLPTGDLSAAGLVLQIILVIPISLLRLQVLTRLINMCLYMLG